MKTPIIDIPIHRALIRPIMLGGAERELVIINTTFIAMLILGVGLTKITLLASLFLVTAGQYALVKVGQYDPLMSRVYLRHIQYRGFYPAHSSRLARTPLVKAAPKTGT